MSEITKHILVGVTKQEKGRANIEIKFIPGEEAFSLEQCVETLVAATALCIRLAPQSQGKKDFEMMEFAVAALNKMFVDVDSFSDGVLNTEVLK